MTRSSALSAWTPAALYCAAIFIQSSFPSPGGPAGLPGADKLLHFSGYALLGMLFFRAFGMRRPRAPAGRLLFLSASCAALYALSDEIHQHFNPHRNGDPGDLLADVLGGLCGAGLCAVLGNPAVRRMRKNPALTKLTRLYKNIRIKRRKDGGGQT